MPARPPKKRNSRQSGRHRATIAAPVPLQEREPPLQPNPLIDPTDTATANYPPPTLREALIAHRDQWQRRAAAIPGLGIVGPESAFWVVLLLAVPMIAIILDLATGVRLDMLPPVDFDYWWHLAVGEWILDHHRVPTTDPFSWTYGGQEWIAHEWLAEVILALLVRAGGYITALLFTTALAVFAIWRLLAAARFYGMSRRVATFLMLATGAAFLRPGVMTVRPQLWTFAFLAILCAELAAYDTGRRKQLWLLPPLFTIWININLTALIGIGCLGAFVLDRLIRRPIDRHVVTIGLLSCLALLINPNHVKLFELLLGYLDPDAGYRLYVFEWLPPRREDLTHLPYFIGLALLIPAFYFAIRSLMATLATGVALVTMRKQWQPDTELAGEVMLDQPEESPERPSPVGQALVAFARTSRPHFWPAAPLLVLAYQSWEAIRYIPLFLMVGIVFTGWLIWRWGYRGESSPEFAPGPLLPLRPWAIAPPLVAAAIAIVIVTQVDDSQFKRDPVAAGRYPVDAVTLYMINYAGIPLFNTYDYGGYLIYRFLGTDNKVYIDGRAEMYGDERFRLWLSLSRGEAGWKEYFDEQGIRAVMIRRSDGLVTQIERDPDWVRVYPDLRVVPLDEVRHLLYIRKPEGG